MSWDGLDDDLLETTIAVRSRLEVVFVDINSLFLSTENKVQTRTLDLVLMYMSQGSIPSRKIHVLLEDNVADYNFDPLWKPECKSLAISLWFGVLDMIFLAESSFLKTFVNRDSTVIRVVHYVGEVPYHSSQIQNLKLVSNYICKSLRLLQVLKFGIQKFKRWSWQRYFFIRL